MDVVESEAVRNAHIGEYYDEDYSPLLVDHRQAGEHILLHQSRRPIERLRVLFDHPVLVDVDGKCRR